MKTAAIVIDEWKLAIFDKHLKEAKFKYAKFSGPTKGVLTLKVETEKIAKLAPVVQAANDEARKSNE